MRLRLHLQSEKPIYLQIAEEVEDAIFTGAFAEEAQIPSTTEISTRFTINPATVLKGINLLVEREILYKKRGMGMFVKAGAVERIRRGRSDAFSERYVLPLLREAEKLGLKRDEIHALLERGIDNARN